MKIAVMGAFTQSNLESFLAQAFRDLGHTVVTFDAWQQKGMPWFDRRVVSLMSGLPRIRHSYRASYQSFINDRCMKFLEEEKPDFVIVHNGAELHPHTIQTIVKRYHIPFATFAADDPTLGLLLPEYLPCIPHFTHVFASESALVPKLGRLTSNRVEFVSCGAPINIYKPVVPSDSERQLFECNLGYVSSGYSGSP